jgi:hypothetical protein
MICVTFPVKSFLSTAPEITGAWMRANLSGLNNGIRPPELNNGLDTTQTRDEK